MPYLPGVNHATGWFESVFLLQRSEGQRGRSVQWGADSGGLISVAARFVLSRLLWYTRYQTEPRPEYQ